MKYVEKIKIVGNNFPGSHVLKKGIEFECEDVNLLVGEQGCGKSTLLHLLQRNEKNDIKIFLSEHTIKKGVSTFYFDSEKDNPRTKNPELFTKPSGENIGIGYGGALLSRFKSHGEVMREFVIGAMQKAKNCVILLDEPESGLSITNQFILIETIKKAVKNKCQLFIATHCFPLIESFNVISLEHNKKMSGIDFINKIKKGIK